MSVHIMLLGQREEPILTGIRHHSGVSKVYILHSPDTRRFTFAKYARGVKKKLVDFGYQKVELVEIEAFDMGNVMEAIRNIVDQEMGKSLSINITGGTNLMSAAAAIAAYARGIRAYYVLDEDLLEQDQTNPIVELPTPNYPITRGLKDTQLQILRLVLKLGDNVNSAQLRDEAGISPQVLSYHIRQLSKRGLITARRGWTTTVVRSGIVQKVTDSRILTIELTDAGRFAVNVSL